MVFAASETTVPVGSAILVLALFGAVTASIAGGKGRSRFEYFILGFIFPAIGLIIALLLKPPKRHVPAPRPPGWYSDPWGHARVRYYDGWRWTYFTDPPTVNAEAAPPSR